MNGASSNRALLRTLRRASNVALSPLRLRLMAFAIICTIPALLLLATHARKEDARLREHAISTAETAAALLEARLTQSLAFAEDAAYLMAAFAVDTEAARRRCPASLLITSRRRGASTFDYLALDANGNVICSARPPTTPTNGADRAHVREAMQTGKPAVSGYVLGHTGGKGAIQVVVPVSNGPTGSLQLGVAALLVQGVTAGIHDGSNIAVTLTVFDHAGLLVGRYPEIPDILPGVDYAASALFAKATTLVPGELRGLDGRRREYVFRRVDFHGKPTLWIAGSVEVETVQATLTEAHEHELYLALLMLAGVICFAAFAGGPMVLARLGPMQSVAQAVTQGLSGSRIRLTWRDELRSIEEAFNHMLDAIDAERAKLQESERRYRMLFEHNLDGVLLTEPNGVILAANPAACEILARSEQELRSLGKASLVDPGDPRLAQLLQVRQAIGKVRGELRFLRPDGSFIEAEIASSLFQDKDGNLQTSIVLRDMTELNSTRTRLMQLNSQLEQLVEQRTAQLSSAIRELETFAQTVSHDLRAPLRTMDGFAQALQLDYGAALPPKALHYLTRIRAGAQKLATLIDGLLALARLGRRMPNLSDCDTRAIVQEVLDETAAAHPSWVGGFRVGVLPVCRADPVLLRQVWVNLIGNAYKYSSRKPYPWIEVGAEQLDGAIVFYVRDNGAGFDMAYSGKLFEVFQRLHPESEFEGTGVGLAIVKQIVEKHGGRVWATGSIGEGATFYFQLADAASS